MGSRRIAKAAGAFFISTAIYLYLQAKKKKEDKTSPPIAPGYLPVVGHLLSVLQPVTVHELFTSWSKEVGPVFTCYFGSQKWIVLNTFEAIKDLIVDRGNIYSSRNLPETLTEDFFQGEKGGGFAFYKYNDNWRRLRKVAHVGLIKPKINGYQPLLDDRRTALLGHLYDLSKTPENTSEGVTLNKMIEHYSMTNILAILYGSMCSFEPGHPQLHTIFELTDKLAQSLSPADQLREFFPILQTVWPVKREKYLNLRADFLEFHSQLLGQFKEQYNKDPNSVDDCFVKEVMQSGVLNDIEIMYFVGVFVGAGSDTTATTIEWLVALLANHPEIQDKAYEEIKQVVGTDRLPNIDDEYDLPYLQCIIMETLRLRPPAPVSIPHSNTKDDIYKEWLIPKDTVIVMNVFASNLDSRRFPQPEKFIPDRHMDHVLNSQNKQIFTQSIEDRPHLSFSTGRRVCVGIHLAEQSLFMATAMLLSSFKFERPTDDLIDVDSPKDIRNATFGPKHYKVRLVPRHDRVSEFIH